MKNYFISTFCLFSLECPVMADNAGLRSLGISHIDIDKDQLRKIPNSFNHFKFAFQALDKGSKSIA